MILIIPIPRNGNSDNLEEAQKFRSEIESKLTEILKKKIDQLIITKENLISLPDQRLSLLPYIFR